MMKNYSWLKYLLIDHEKLTNKRYFVAVLMVLAFAIVYAINQGKHMGMTGDFTVFWMAGKNFLAGNDLYSGIGGACRFIYPPFAAMIFQLFAFMPLKVAASVFDFANILLFIFSIYLTRTIFEFYIEDKKIIKYALIFSTLTSLRFFLYHFQYVQMNILVFVLCLLGVLLILRNKENPAIICFVIATFIKIIPIFFLVWLFFRGNYKTWVKVGIVSACCIALPLIWRGATETGIKDVKNYYTSFIEPFKEGRVEPEFENQSLSAGIYKISLPAKPDSEFDYNLLNLSEEAAKQVYKYSFLLIFILFIFCLTFVSLTKKPITFIEIAIIYLTTHLLSGITWEYHLVSMLFVYTSLFVMSQEIQSLFLKGITFILMFIVLLLSIVGLDTVGNTLYHYIGGYSFLTWMMVLLLLFFSYSIILKNKFTLLH